MRRRTLLRLAVVGAAGALLSACTPRRSPPAPPTASAESEVPIVPEARSSILVVYFSRARENHYYGGTTELEVGNTLGLSMPSTRRGHPVCRRASMGSMTRYGIDAAAALRLVAEGIVVDARHQLVAPSALRSDAMSILFRRVRSGEANAAEARLMLERLTRLRVRVLGDRVSRATAWRLARDQGWDDTRRAEYIAVSRLQADALVALDPVLIRQADGLVALASFEALALSPA